MDNKILFHCNEAGPLLVRRKLLPKGWVVRYLNHSARLTLEQEHSEREITVLVSGTQNGVSYGVLVYFTADGALQAQRVVESDYGSFLKRLSQLVMRKLETWGSAR